MANQSGQAAPTNTTSTDPTSLRLRLPVPGHMTLFQHY